MQVLLDTNIVLDVLFERQPFYTASAALWNAAQRSANKSTGIFLRLRL